MHYESSNLLYLMTHILYWQKTLWTTRTEADKRVHQLQDRLCRERMRSSWMPSVCAYIRVYMGVHDGDGGSLGTLTLGLRGESRFFGQTSRSEVC